jgi:hypothetical protein
MATNNVTNDGTRTPHGIYVAQGASTPNYVVLGAGQVPIGTTAGDPSGATLSSGTNVTVTNSSGAITIGSYTMPASASGPASGIAPYFAPLNLPGAFNNVSTDSQTAGVASFFSNDLIFIPFTISDASPIESLNILVLASAAASSVIMGVYNTNPSTTLGPPSSVYNLPFGAPVISGSVATTTSNAIASATVTATSLTPGKLYWAAFQASTGTTLSYYVGQLNIGSPNFSAFSVGVGAVASVLYKSNSFGAGLPTIASSASGFTVTPTAYLPVIYANYL